MKRIIALIIIILLGIVICRAEDNKYLTVYCLNVGQGDATVINCNGHYMLIDSGNTDNAGFIYSFLRNTLQIDHLEAIIATHPHSDHIGGMAAALNACSVDVLYTSVVDYDTSIWQDVIEYAEMQGTPIVVPSYEDYFFLGGACIEILGPLRDNINLNNMSLITRITFGNTSFIWTGDAEWEEEYDLIDYGYDLSADVLKVGHHGSNTSSTQLFIDAISPKYAIISVGKDNGYGHPSEEVLERLINAGAEIYRTDIDDTIICDSDGNTITFRTSKAKQLQKMLK